MKTLQAFLYSIGVAGVSLILLMIRDGVIPSAQVLFTQGVGFVAVAFIVFRFFLPKKNASTQE